MNKTGDLVEIIKEFICKPKKGRALLINGEWGSGKTFFMQNLSEREISPASDKKIYTFLGNYLHFKFKKFKKIYISLKGINSLEEIADTIVKGILFKSKKMYILLHVSLFVGFIVVLISVSYFIGKYIGIDISVFCTVVIAALGIFGRIEFKKNLLNSFFDWEDFSNYLFIFDDLERLPEKFSYADVLLYTVYC
ncbi:MAG: hypothetical protein LBL71_02615 [Endomicrobium sp.]|jgi:Cdc6-like AAA superfamily ATPase|nr:hypothetical protein [Endomicrobium sp.]